MAKKRTITINPWFKFAIWACSLMWILSFGGMLAIVWWPGVNAEINEEVRQTCEKIVWLISGAFVGLLGGGAAVPDK
jgi:hypothetical protein